MKSTCLKHDSTEITIDGRMYQVPTFSIDCAVVHWDSVSWELLFEVHGKVKSSTLKIVGAGLLVRMGLEDIFILTGRRPLFCKSVIGTRITRCCSLELRKCGSELYNLPCVIS